MMQASNLPFHELPAAVILPGKAKLLSPKAGKPVPKVPVSPTPGFTCLGALSQASRNGLARIKKKVRLEGTAFGVELFLSPNAENNSLREWPTQRHQGFCIPGHVSWDIILKGPMWAWCTNQHVVGRAQRMGTASHPHTRNPGPGPQLYTCPDSTRPTRGRSAQPLAARGRFGDTAVTQAALEDDPAQAKTQLTHTKMHVKLTLRP